jgi:hypothetical protein
MAYTIFIIIFVIIIYNIFSKSETEHYDTLINNTNIGNCAQQCKTAKGCYGFGYNKDKKKCYLSKTYIKQQPSAIVNHYREYTDKNIKCNKLFQINKITDNTPDILRKKNASYMCDNMEKNKSQNIYSYEKKIEKIEDINKDISNMKLENYDIMDYNWGNKTDRKILSKQKLPEKQDDIYFKKDKREYLGKYIYPYKCVRDVTEKDCILDCKNKINCQGVEWNPVFIQRTNKVGLKDPNLYKYNVKINVCCPKTEITDKINRRSIYKYGNFYLKQKYKKLNPKENIIITY